MKTESVTTDRGDGQEPVFELGLVLAGAVSGGAYQAGVLDCLMEALERWEDAKAEESRRFREAVENRADFEWSVPRHSVRIRVITGASAGSISAALLTMRAGKRYGWLTDTQAKELAAVKASVEKPLSPLYDAWVRQVNLTELLSLDDAPRVDQRMPSLLNGRALNRIMRDVLSARIPTETASQGFFADPVSIAFTACDLDGRAEGITMSIGNATVEHHLRSHSHVFRFRVHFQSQPQPWTDMEWTSMAAEELSLFRNSGNQDDASHPLLEAALASSAFPVGLPPRRVRRRQPESNADSNQETARYVDGGVFDNEPIALAKTLLWGDQSPASGGPSANKALVMIDPFPEQPEGWDDDHPGVLSTLWRLLIAWKNQARYQHADLKAAQNESTYHMYMLAPSRGDDRSAAWHKAKGRGAHVASAALGAFGGFLHQDFRVHDYLLGRRNAQKFLADWLSLPASNPLFRQWPSTIKTADSFWSTAGVEQHELPVIPLVAGLHPKQCSNFALPPWPQVRLQLDSLVRLIGDRVTLVVNRELVFRTRHSFLDPIWRFLQRTLLVALKSQVTDWVTSRITQELGALDLLEKPVNRDGGR